MKKSVMIGLAFGILATSGAVIVLAQANKSVYSGPTVELSYIHGYTASDRVQMEELVKRFNESHPNIVVKGQAVPWSTTWQQLPSLVSAGRAADVVAMTEDVITNFMARGAVQEISSKDLSQTGIKSGSFYKNLWEGSKYNGKLYGVPLSSVSFVMFYNKDLMEKFGISKVPKTRAEFIAATQACTTDNTGKKPTEDGFEAGKLATTGVTVALGQGNLMAYGILRGNNGNLFDSKLEPSFNSPQAIEALQFMVDLVQKYKVSKPSMTAESGIADFRAGKSCFNIEGAWMNTQYKGIKDFKVGVGPVPALGTKKAAFWGAFTSLVLPKQKDSYDANKRAAALEFTRWMVQPEQNLYWTTSGALPTQPVVAKSKEFLASDFADVAADLEAAYVPTGVAWLPQILGPWWVSIDNILLGKKSVKDALNDGVAESKKQVEQARQALPK